MGQMGKKPIERKIVSVSSKKASEAQKDAQSESKVLKNASSNTGPEKTPKSRATGLRIIAVLLWLAAIAFEVAVISLLAGILYIPGNQTMWLIIGIALDLVCVIIGSLIWKQSNRIDPASEKNKVKFFLWNNMGVIAAVIAFLPLVIILIKNKNMDAKAKKIVTVIAAIGLVAAIGLSVDYNPVSAEDLDAAKQEAVIQNDGIAYWTQWGRSYHFDLDCHTIQNSAVVYEGTIEEAFEARRTDPCDFCAGGAEAKLAEDEAEGYSSD